MVDHTVSIAALSKPSLVVPNDSCKPAASAAAVNASDVYWVGSLVAIRYGDRLVDAGINPSVGSVGDSYDNSLSEKIIGLYKTEVIRRRGPWRNIDDVEFTALEWVHLFNTRRLFGPIGYIPPAQHEDNYYAARGQLTLPVHT